MEHLVRHISTSRPIINVRDNPTQQTSTSSNVCRHRTQLEVVDPYPDKLVAFPLPWLYEGHRIWKRLPFIASLAVEVAHGARDLLARVIYTR
jgi:hypothetical protein